MSTLKATNLQNPSSSTVNVTLDPSGNMTVGNNATVTGNLVVSGSFTPSGSSTIIKFIASGSYTA